ncbi:protein SIEVE ELEMENT OCCLUSION B-like [Trifolium pratense]|uniref:protein SIEVE ELEMENT OCCLUSION B-like n=1 Tax=Trifolium pratense TaxID=57577 RepID=UPI001E697C48|nr:protein SIEVE ELEMENT OCCLUSION B-like [Trifolium pratense]
MSLSNGTKLPNPFDLDDSQILDKVYLTHLHDDDKCDKDVLFHIVSNVILRSKLAESRGAITGFKPEFPTLKLISCQMIMTPHGERYVHQTTMWILQRLKTYSWDAKALVTLAAFALEYGNLLYLTDTSTADQLVNSLKQLNQIQNRKVTVPATDLVVLIMEVFNHIRDWATWSGVGYDTLEVPSLSDALQDIHVAVYWIIASIVAATGNINGVSDYKLSDFKGKLSSVDSKLKEHLKLSKGQIDSVEQNLKRKKAISNPKDIVDILKILLQRDGDNLLIYDGSTKSKTNIEVFKGKYVLLFISSLNKVEDEILLLNYIYDRLKDNPQEMKGYKKEDFKILWIPIFEGDQKIKFDSLKNKIKFYAVEYFSELPGIGLIREIFNYWDKPVVPVLSPLSDIINDDAMNLIFQWGIDAFPFRKKDGDELDQKWKWFWDVTKRLNLGIQVKGDRYIFIYGGGDKKWIQDFTMALEKTKRHEAILRADAIIEHYHIGKDDPKIVPRFWIEIESKTLKKHQDALDCKIQGIVKSLLCLKQDPQGWVILTKGYNVKLLGHGEPMYQTLADFDIWKDKVLQKEGFDIAFKEHYETKIKETYVKQPCAIINVDNNINGNVIATISCPNPTCGREMEVSSVNYKCCHRDHATQNGKI